MVEERDFALVGIPFAAGIAAGLAVSDAVSIRAVHSAASLTYSATLALAVILLSGTRRSDPLPRKPGPGIALLFLICGFFCSANSFLCGIFPENRNNLKWASEAMGWLSDLLEGMPFSDPGTSALLKALLTGDRSALPKETVTAFREAGASHILALSGLHLGIIYLFLSYCIATGAGPSLVRAFLFILIGETAAILHREKVPTLTLMAAMTVQLAIEPEVITSLGFQLSYLAMAGIMLVYPHLERIYPGSESAFPGRFDPMRRIWQSAMLSISCQLFTGPLAWIRFHSFPKYFIITNLTALPLTSAVMLLSVCAIILSALGICPGILVRIDEYAVRTLVFCLKTIAEIRV